ncbi:MAG TPA: glycoside hydrolase family 13 protein [Clostridia bacterium]|nr:glycoside hydrolase family 13 protein [Clostridia bacterium]HQC68004.1 glycoside hydrolase family 13 protein [Clostridia bacterium]
MSGVINRYAVLHINSGTYAYAIDSHTLCIRLRTAKNDCKSVIVHYMNVYDHSTNRKKENMAKILQDEHFDLYEAKISQKEKHFKYFFELIGEKEQVFYTSDGFMGNEVKNENSFFFPVINDDEIYKLPKWAEGATVYQIFVDRFNSSCDKDFVNADWNDKPLRSHFFGGDFKGIEYKLDYIKSLGIDIVYLSPIFSSATNHKYDIEDYYSIDEMFGGRKELSNLIQSIHKKGMRIVLDCVFNHMSNNNKIFRDVLEKGQNSQYKDWFYIHDYPVSMEKCNYDTFAGCVPSMPRINTSNRDAMEYLVNSAVYWTKELGVDGWRLDVADEVSARLWRHFRTEISKVNSEALIIGEIWNDASKWMMGDQMHTVTNYKYRKWLLDFIQGKIDAVSFWNKMASNKMLYKTMSYNYLINLLGSHDTKRITSVVGKEKAMLALLMTLTYQGIGLIYYGDEIGLIGMEDPDNRRTMPWRKISEHDTEQFRQLALLKKQYPSLKYGRMRPVTDYRNIISFERIMPDQTVEVYVNFSDKDVEIKDRVLLFNYPEINKVNTSINCIKALSFAICIKNQKGGYGK